MPNQTLAVNPSERPTVKEILSHSQLKEGDEGTPTHHAETVPSLLDPGIIAAMANIGFNN